MKLWLLSEFIDPVGPLTADCMRHRRLAGVVKDCAQLPVSLQALT